MTDEEFYDTEIAPTLANLGKRCEERSLAFLAVVQFDQDGSTGRTVSLPKGAPAVVRWANALASCALRGGVNLDSFLFAVMKEARETGHSSAVLAQLGVPTSPTVSP